MAQVQPPCGSRKWWKREEVSRGGVWEPRISEVVGLGNAETGKNLRGTKEVEWVQNFQMGLGILGLEIVAAGSKIPGRRFRKALATGFWDRIRCPVDARGSRALRKTMGTRRYFNCTAEIRRGGQRAMGSLKLSATAKYLKWSRAECFALALRSHSCVHLWEGSLGNEWEEMIWSVAYLLLGTSGATTMWGSRHTVLTAVNFGCLPKFQVGATEAGVYIG